MSALQGVGSVPVESYPGAGVAAQAAGVQGPDLTGAGAPSPSAQEGRVVQDTVTLAGGAGPRGAGPREVAPPPGQENTGSGTADPGARRGTEGQAQLAVRNRAIQYNFDRDLGILQATIVDPATKEVIREVPPEERLRLAQRFRELVLSRLQERREADVEPSEGAGVDREA